MSLIIFSAHVAFCGVTRNALIFVTFGVAFENARLAASWAKRYPDHSGEYSCVAKNFPPLTWFAKIPSADTKPTHEEFELQLLVCVHSLPWRSAMFAAGSASVSLSV